MGCDIDNNESFFRGFSYSHVEIASDFTNNLCITQEAITLNDAKINRS